MGGRWRKFGGEPATERLKKRHMPESRYLICQTRDAYNTARRPVRGPNPNYSHMAGPAKSRITDTQLGDDLRIDE